jgi:ribosome-associated toxin RatA of RatAB toxin-antitoxin module
MNTESSILIRAPKQHIFDVTSDLSRWPELLPHYRSIDYLERGDDRHVVRMACHRDGIPISWISEQIVDRKRLEIHFLHLRAFTKGMAVVWSFEEKPEGTFVRIVHVLRFRVPALAPLAEPIIGGFFVENIANKTLRAFKTHFESLSA